MLLKKLHFLLSFALLLFFTQANAQITSSGLTGTVLDDSLKALPGAIIKAMHQPSGSAYGTVSEKNGTFNILNMRVGGPYTITITYSGFKTATYDEVYLSLGENYNISVKLGAEELSEVEVKAARNPLFNNQMTGASRVITSQELSRLPSTSRSINDFTRLTPQSSGTNFMGRDNRYNNMQINGASINNSFGLAPGFPGGAQPISLDAVDQIQVAIAPYDVKQSNFTGANVNVITKSGTNTYNGTAYYYWRNETFQGKRIGSDTLAAASKKLSNFIGFTAGGPIIKNKLFFFVSGEIDRGTYPGIDPNWKPKGSTGTFISRTPVDSMVKLRNFLQTKYGYDPGAYEDFGNNFVTQNNRLLARVDWNINEKNKANFSIIQVFRNDDQLTNSRSAAGGTSVSNTRIGSQSLVFANSLYSFKDVVTSLSGEWLSNIKNNVSNQLLVTYTHVRDTRSTPGSDFPFVDISFDDANPLNNYMSFGSELFSHKNDVIYNTTNIYNNLTINKGIHNITAGASFMYMSIANSFFPYGTMYYRYGSLQQFMNDEAPAAFGYSYPFNGQDGYVKVNFGQGSLYAQDKVNLTKNLVLTGGLRVDQPFYFNKLPTNTGIDTLRLMNPQGERQTYDISKWPEAKPIVSPRLAFNWKPLKYVKLQVRGGTGIFTGQLPFVWFTNQPGNSGSIINNRQLTSASDLKNIHFYTSFDQMPDSVKNKYFSKQASNTVPSQIALVARNFKMPRIWRSDIAVDYKLPWYDLVASAEFIYTKDVYAAYQFNANLPKPSDTMKILDSTEKAISTTERPFYSSNKLYGFLTSNAYILENSKKGEAWSMTVGLARPSRKGWFGSLYYTYMMSKDVTPNAGAQAGSVYQALPNVGSPNENVLSYSDYFVPHRVVGSFSYRVEYLKHLATTISLFYEGYAGVRYSYTYLNDVNNDGTTNDLIYIPKDASELHWVDLTAGANATKFTAAQQQAAFDAFMSQDKYLNAHRGEYAQRNGATYPYYGKFDFALLQDVFSYCKKRRNTLQLSVNVMNLGNLINSNWGVSQRAVINRILSAKTVASKAGITGYSFQTITDSNGNPVLPTSTFVKNISVNTVWSMQLGLRLIF